MRPECMFQFPCLLRAFSWGIASPCRTYANILNSAVVGNVDAGKSTMLGVLVKGGLDDGRGKARVNLFRHKHEIESGRTSSVGMEIMGYVRTMSPFIYDILRKPLWPNPMLT